MPDHVTDVYWGAGINARPIIQYYFVKKRDAFIILDIGQIDEMGYER